MREELLEALTDQRASPDIAAAADFSFKALDGELTVAGVFVRIFVEQPTFAVADPAAFCKARGLLVRAHQFCRRQPGQHRRMWCSGTSSMELRDERDGDPMTSEALPMLSVQNYATTWEPLQMHHVVSRFMYTLSAPPSC